MDLEKAETMASDLMRGHGIAARGWYFDWDRAVKRLGAAHFRTKRITLSRPLTELNDEASVRNTILHEIAHVLAGAQAGHGPQWRIQARAIGCDARAVSTDAVLPDMPWSMVCPNCGKRSPRARRTKTMKACGDCCRKYSGGRFDARFVMSWESNRTLASR